MLAVSAIAATWYLAAELTGIKGELTNIKGRLNSIDETLKKLVPAASHGAAAP